jgi:adenylate kinase family enzyme
MLYSGLIRDFRTEPFRSFELSKFAPMKRVMIIGGAGAGKSTLAQRLGEITGLPVVHIDPMYWKPRWVQRDIEEAQHRVRQAASAEEWIFDGNNSSTFRERLTRADTLIFLGSSAEFVGKSKADLRR